MKRIFEEKLLNWKNTDMKKPLMVIGARQIGKTYIIEKFAKENFEEFLMACNKDILLNEIRNSYNNFTPLPEFAHKEALELYKSYLCIGGMPEAVNNFIENNMNILMFDNKILNNIIDMYIADMTKYVNNISESIKIEKIYKSIPTQLANENRKFKYTNVEKNGRKRMYENPLEWLIASKMILICNSVKRVEIPLKVYSDENSFKIYLSDIGLLTNLSEIKLTDIMLDTPFIFKGALVENFVAQELQSKENSLYYWTLNNSAEVDFLYYSKNDGIIPIEVKAGNNIKSTSLNTYIEKHNPKYAIRLSTKNFGFENNIKSIPLYATFCID